MQKPLYNLLKGTTKLLSALPLGFHRRCGEFLGIFALKVLGYRRSVVDINLARSFPDKKYGELKEIRKGFYKHFGRIIGEAVWFGGCNAERLEKARIIRMTNPEEINRLWEIAPSVVVMIGHCGNWELACGFAHYAPDAEILVPSKDVHMVYKQLSSPVWDAFIKDNRRAPMSEGRDEVLIETSSVMRFILTHKNEKKVYVFITDQYPYEGGSPVEIGEFMHQDTQTMVGAARLASRLGMAVAYLSFRDASGGGYEWTYRTISENASGEDPVQIMKKYYQMLQEDIEAQPCNYLWSHKRWK